MTTLTEGRYSAEALVSEANGTRARDVVTVITGQNLSAMTVVGKIAASGKYTILAPAAGDGSQNAAGIMFSAANATAADLKQVALLRDCEVNGNELIWPGGITGPQKTTAIGQLAALGIIVR